MDEENLHEPQIHHKEGQRKHPSGDCECFRRVEMADEQSTDKKSIRQKVHHVPEDIKIPLHA